MGIDVHVTVVKGRKMGSNHMADMDQLILSDFFAGKSLQFVSIWLGKNDLSTYLFYCRSVYFVKCPVSEQFIGCQAPGVGNCLFPCARGWGIDPGE